MPIKSNVIMIGGIATVAIDEEIDKQWVKQSVSVVMSKSVVQVLFMQGWVPWDVS